MNSTLDKGGKMLLLSKNDLLSHIKQHFIQDIKPIISFDREDFSVLLNYEYVYYKQVVSSFEEILQVDFSIIEDTEIIVLIFSFNTKENKLNVIDDIMDIIYDTINEDAIVMLSICDNQSVKNNDEVKINLYNAPSNINKKEIECG